MLNNPVCGNDPAMPDLASCYDRALYVWDALYIIETTWEADRNGAPITSLIAAFLPIAISLCDDLEKLK